jgi:two-component system, response regulator
MNAQADILLIEDSDSDAEIIVRALRRGNIMNSIHHVEDGEAAIDFLFCSGKYAGRKITKKPRVILLDLKMPKVNGLEVVRKIRSDARTQAIPIVILTSSKEDRDIIDSYRLGINSYVVKSVNYHDFSKLVVSIGEYWLYTNQPPI